MKRGFRRFALYSILVISVLNVVGNIILYLSFLETENKISAYASSGQGTIGLVVEEDDPPVVTIIEPQALIYRSHRNSINYTAVDSTLKSCWYSLDWGKTNVTINCEENVTGISSVEGSNEWIVYANDTRGNVGSDNVVFNVNTSSGDGGFSGGGDSSPTSSLEIKGVEFSVSELNIGAISGERISREITLRNVGSEELLINVGVLTFSDFVSVDKNEMVLGPGEEESVVLSFIAPEPGSYSGKIAFRAPGLAKDIFVLINVKTGKSLLDVSLSIPESSKVLRKGSDLDAFISLAPIGGPEEINASIRYLIRDFEGNILFEESEKITVSDTMNFVKAFPSSDLDPGDYNAVIEVSYQGGFGSSSARFSIPEEQINFEIFVIGAFIALVVIIISFFMIRYIRAKIYGYGDET